MPLFLYDLPDWLLGVVVVATTVGVANALYFAARRIFNVEFSEGQKGLAMGVLGIAATINSLLLAFSAVSVWDSFHDADSAVAEEANTVGELARDLAVYNTPKSTQARELLRRYTETVIKTEWPTMQRGEASLEAWNAFDDTFVAASALDVTNPKEQSMMAEIFQRMNELLKQRRTRLYTAASEVPMTLWAVVLIGTALSFLTTAALEPSAFHHVLVGILAVAVGLVFFFIIAMDRPFAGTESISPAPFQSALDNMARWDARAKATTSANDTTPALPHR